ncbi:hypothetical protein ACTHOQ_14125 [Solibacillus silvestris]|uniref:hypothetical protein n=1 Tax=Solibacillus silvestris TaxID=76853 RepID=UPI003F7E60C1
MYDKEKVYDEQISPLMAQILKICKENDVQMAMQFYLQDAEANVDGEPMYCTSFINNLKEEQIDYVATEAMRWGKSGKPFIMTATIRG